MRNIKRKKTKSLMSDKRLTDTVDHVLPNLHISSQRTSMFVSEDNDVVIKMIIKGPSPSMRHIPRTHRETWTGCLTGSTWILESISSVSTSPSKSLTYLPNVLSPLKDGRSWHHMHSCSRSLVLSSVLKDEKMSKRHAENATPNKGWYAILRVRSSLIKFVIKLYQFQAKHDRERSQARYEPS